MSMDLMVKAMKTKVGNPLRKLVLVKLADNASDQGECWPSYQHIADQCEIDRSTVRKHIKQLEAQGLLRIENREGPKGNSTNLYYLNLWGVGQNSTPVGPESTGVGPESTGVGPESTGGVGPESTRTSHSFEPVNEPKPMANGEQELVEFERFWKLYPRKANKATAEKAWNKLKVSTDLFAVIAQALAKQCTSIGWLKSGGQYIPHGATWLNGKRWEDELTPGLAKASAYNGLPQHTPDMYQEAPDGQANF